MTPNTLTATLAPLRGDWARTADLIASAGPDPGWSNSTFLGVVADLVEAGVVERRWTARGNEIRLAPRQGGLTDWFCGGNPPKGEM